MYTLTDNPKSRGWIKVPRSYLQTGLLSNPKFWAFWSWLLLKAAHTRHVQAVGRQHITLEPGQLIFGRKAAARELWQTEGEIRSHLRRLTEEPADGPKLTIKRTNKFSIISIVNWHTYQHGKECGQPADEPTNGENPTTNKNVLKRKENRDPRVHTLVSFFVSRVEQTKGFRPEVNGQDGKLVKSLLARYDEDTIKSLLDHFLQSEKADKVGITLSIALSAHSVNSFLQAQKQTLPSNPTTYFGPGGP